MHLYRKKIGDYESKCGFMKEARIFGATPHGFLKQEYLDPHGFITIGGNAWLICKNQCGGFPSHLNMHQHSHHFHYHHQHQHMFNFIIIIITQHLGRSMQEDVWRVRLIQGLCHPGFGTTFVIFDHHTVKVQMYKYNSRIHQGVPTEKTKARVD